MRKDRNYSDKLAIAADHKEKERNYWLNKLSGNIGKSVFPYDFESPETDVRKDTAKFKFPDEIFSQLNRLSNNTDYTLHLILAAGLVALLFRYTGKKDIIIGTSIYKQEVEGEFTNTALTLRSQFNQQFTFRKLLKHMAQVITEAVENQSYPIEILMDELNLSFSRGNTLFDTAILVENIHDKKYLQHININLLFFFRKTIKNLELILEYNTLLYRETTIERIVSHYTALMKDALRNPEAPISDLSILSGDEKNQLLVKFNNTGVKYLEDKTIGLLIEEPVKKRPGASALIYKDNHLSFKELDKKANQLARILRNKGVSPGTIVGIMIKRSPEMVISILGILKAGGAYLPIEPELPIKRISSTLKDAGVSILLTESQMMSNHSFTDLQDLQQMNTQPLLTPQRMPIRDFNRLPFPDRSLISYEKYNRYIGLAMVKNTISLQGTRGCPYNCAYCHKIWPKSHVVRSAENIFAEVKRYYNMGIRRFVIVDDIFNLDKSNSAKFFRLIIDNGMELQLFFPNGVRGDLLTRDYIDLMVRAGTTSIAIALETASPRLQKLIRKNLDIKKMRENITYFCTNHPHVILELFTIHGFPTETEEEALLTLDFIKSFKWLHFPYVHILKIYPNTDMVKLAMENGVSREAIAISTSLAYHEVPETLPFDKRFSITFQADFINRYFLSKERLLHVLPHQMKVLTEDEIVQKYDSYWPGKISCFPDILELAGIHLDELGVKEFLEEDRVAVPNLDEKIKKTFSPQKNSENALRVLLLDLSQLFSGSQKMLYDVVEPPLGLLYVMTFLKKQFTSKVNGKIAKSRIDFDNYAELKALLKEFKPDIIGIRTLTFYKDFFHNTAAVIRQWGITVPIIAGGPYATSDYETILQDRNIDLVVMGEGEITFSELIGKTIKNNGQLPHQDVLKEIPGIAFIPHKMKPRPHFARELLLLDELKTGAGEDPGENEPHINKPSDLAYVIFTSGSTGNPKGVMIDHRSVVRLMFNERYPFQFNNNDTWTMFHSYAFDFSVWEMYGALMYGGKLIIVPEMTTMEPGKFLELLKKQRVTVLNQTPTIFYHLINEEMKAPGKELCLKYVIFGGEALKPAQLKKWKEKYPETKLINMYGITETTVHVTYKEINHKDIDENKSYIGEPIPTLSTYIMDSNLNQLPIGIPGELCVGGKGVSRGYLNRPELTQQKFVSDPYQPGETLYRSGDLVQLKDLNRGMEYLGRIDHQVKIRGFRIELQEVEKQLLKYEQVEEAVVISTEGETGDKSLCAYLVLNPNQSLSVSNLRGYLSRELPAYMIPSHFVELEKLPLTPNGKVDRNALANPLEKPLQSGIEYAAPQNKMEEMLVGIWENVLGKDRIGINDNFFIIGGDSIKAIQIAARIRKEGYKVEIKDIFQAQSISQLSSLVKKSGQAADQSVIQGIVPLTPIQRWFFQHEFIDPHHYNQAMMLYSKEGFEKDFVEAVFMKLQEHHDSLRIIYRKENGTIRQEMQGLDYPFSLKVFDLKNIENAAAVLQVKINDIQASIDLEKGPLMKLGLFHLDDGDRLLIVIHHLVIDGISWRILFEDISMLFQQYKKGETLELPLKSDSFKRWSEKLLDYANSKLFLKEKNYWMELESTIVPQIKKDFEQQENFMKNIGSLSFNISAKETHDLLTKANIPFGTEINDILITALGLGIKKTFGIHRLVIALEGHGREEILEDVDISRNIGWFTSIYPVILDISFEEDLSRQVKEIKESLHMIPGNGIGYGILKYLTNEKQKEVSHSTLKPQVSFNYLGQFDSDIHQMPFSMAKEPVGNSQSVRGQRPYELYVSGIIANRQLVMSITYNKKQYRLETIETLMEHFKTLLSRVILFCSTREKKELTPSDLVYKGLSIEALDRLKAQYLLEDIYALTPMQEGLLFHAIYEDASSAYFEQMSYRLQGNLHAPIVKKSLYELFKRHDVLRTVFVYQSLDRPLQVVLKDPQLDFYYKDIASMGDEDKEEFIKEFKKEDKQRSFDLSKDALMRFALIKVNNQEYEFVWSHHHILMDGWCVSILISEFFEIYNNYLENRKHQLPAVKQYKTYIQWLEKQNEEESRDYWQKYLENYQEPSYISQMAFHDANDSNSGYKRQYMKVAIDDEKTHGLKGLARTNHVTLNTVMQAIWGIILGRYNFKRDGVFGAVVSGRPTEIADVESMVGLFINTVPVRIQFEEKITFKELIRRVQKEALDSKPHHYYSLARIQAESNLKQNLLDHILVFENYPITDHIESLNGKNTRNHGLTLTLSNVDVFEQTNYDFNLSIYLGENINLGINYNEHVYERQVIHRISGHIAHIIGQVANDEGIKLEEIALPSEEEKNQILLDFNNSIVQEPDNKSMVRLFAHQVEKNPGSIAIVEADTNISYKELDNKSGQMGRLLQAKGVQPDRVVGIMMNRSIEMMVAILAILKAGGAYLPLDNSFPEERIQYILTDSQAQILLTQSSLLKKIQLPFDHQVMVIDKPGEPMPRGNTVERRKNSGPGNLAYVIYTSGSTGEPKGVMIEHQQVIRLVKNSNYIPLLEGKRLLLTGNMIFDITTFEIWGSLLNGLNLYLEDQDIILDGKKLGNIILKNRVNILHLVPQLFNQLASQGLELFAPLEYFLVGGDLVSPLYINELRIKFPGIKILHMYGPTENTTFSTYFPVDKEYKTTFPIGTPIGNSSAYVVDHTLNLQPIGAVGELVVGGGGVTRGYLNQPELTRDKFLIKKGTSVLQADLNAFGEKERHGVIPNKKFLQGGPGGAVFSKSAPLGCQRQKIYMTGDLARWLPDGNIEFLGRKDYQVKINGIRIELGEIESQLLKINGIKEAVVITRTGSPPDESSSTGEHQYLCAYITTDNQFSNTELRSYLAEKLPPYMVPSYIASLEKFPLTANGKIDRKALPDPVNINYGYNDRYAVPRNEIEKIMLEVWKQVLGRSNININENFFMIGGDSIKAIQIASRMSKAGYKIEVQNIFQNPSIAELAPKVRPIERVADQSVISGSVPLTPIQKKFFRDSTVDTHHNNQSVMFYLKEGFNLEAVKAVFSKIQQHHDVLRISFKEEKGKMIQWNHHLQYPLSIQFFDLQGKQNALKVLETKANKIQASFDLKTGPLMKVALFRLNDGDRLLVVIHHLVIDGISWRILFEDIENLFQQYKKGEPLQLPLKTDSYKLWAEKLYEYANSQSFLKEKTYWAGQESLPTIELETDFEEENLVKDAAGISGHLSEEKTQQLLTKVNEAFGTEINDILLTALGLTFKKIYGHERLLLALEGHGREKIVKGLDIGRTVGWFTSVYPVILDLAYDKNLSRQVKEIKEGLRRVPNKGIGYGILRYLSANEHKEEIAFNLEPQVSFNYLGQFDAELRQLSFEIAAESACNMMSKRARRKYLLEVVAVITGGCLGVTITYSKKQYQAKTVEKLLNVYMEELGNIISFCTAKKRRELTPWDLTYKKLSIETLERLQTQYEIEDVYPLSPIQEGMLFHALMDKSSAAYFEQRSYHISQGELNLDYIRKSLNDLLKRYAVLRTKFVYEDIDRPLQVVLRELQVDFYYNDISKEEAEQKQKYIKEFKEKDRKRPFNLSKDVLMRVAVIQLNESEYEFVWSHHHILLDGWCFGILNADFFEIYNSYLLGREPHLPGVKPYRTYIQWLEEQDKQPSRCYWKKYLEGYEESVGIPRKTGCIKSGKGYKQRIVNYTLGKEQNLGLSHLARKNHVTMNTIFQAVWGIILGQYNAKSDVVFGAVVSGRPAEIDGVELMVGLFINTVPVRIRYQENTTFSQLLEKIQKNAIDNESHHYFPFAEIQAESTLKQNLLDHLFIFENYPEAVPVDALTRQNTGKNRGISLKLSNAETFEQTNYDFNIIIVPGVQPTIVLKYNEYVYRKDVVDRIPGHMKQIFSQVLNNQELRIKELTLLSSLERKKILYEFNNTGAEYPGYKTIHELFEYQAGRTPDRIALIGLTNPKFKSRNSKQIQMTEIQNSKHQLTYKELNKRANGVVHRLKGKGVKPDTIAAIMVERSIEMMVGILGILKTGGAYLPIDPDYPQYRIDFMLKDSNAGILLSMASKMNGLSERIECIFFDKTMENITHYPAQQTSPIKNITKSKQDTLTHSPTQRNLAYIIYTSGSTGRPKGVMIEHRSVANRLNWMQRAYPIDKDDVILQKTTIVFDVSVWELFWWSWQGASLCLLEPGGERSPESVIDAVERHRITTIHFVPSMFHVFLLYLESTGEARKLRTLRCVFSSGEALAVHHAETFNRLTREIKHINLVNLYGPTEATVDVSYFNVSRERCLESMQTLPIGKPIDNIRLYILDKDMQLQPPGMAGELYIAGVGLARGYLNRPGLTGEKFPPNPHIPGERLYRTGDLATLSGDGEIEYLGRLDHQVKIRGFRIELGEIERLLLKHNDIEDSIVIIKEDENADKYLCAYVVLRSSAIEPFNKSQFQEYLDKKLPAYMIPRFYVRLAEIPLLPSGKVNRRALPEPEAAAEKYAAPRDDVEKKLLTLWSEVLSIPYASIGIDDNFFELGGHSLKVTILISKIHQELNVKLPLASIFDMPTIRKLSAHIKQSDKDKFISIQPTEKKDYYILSSAQRRLYFIYLVEPQNTTYNLPMILTLGKDIKRDKIEGALKGLIARHETLRTSLKEVNRLPVQQIHPFEDVEFRLHYDEEALPGGNTATRIIENFIRPFDLSGVPLIRAGLIKLTNGNYIWMTDMHHIVSDGTSNIILAEDFIALYSGKTQQELKIQYKDFSEWQNRLLAGEKIKNQQDYWLNLYPPGEEIPRLELPMDYIRPKVFNFAGARYNFFLEREDAITFKKLASRYGSTLYMNVLAALNTLFYKYTGQTDIIIGAGVAGRSHDDLQGIVGMFVNNLAIRNYPRGDRTYEALLKQVSTNCIQAFENQDLQFEELIDMLKPERDISRNPLFDIVMLVQNFSGPGEGTWINEAGTQFEEPAAVNTPPAINYKHTTSRLDMTILVFENEEDISINIEYYTGIFKKETVERFARHFIRVIKEVTANPMVQLKDINLLSEEEKQDVLHRFNDTAASYAFDRAIHGLFEQQAESRPCSTAVVGSWQTAAGKGKETSVTGTHTAQLTYGELKKNTDELAVHLQQKGIGLDNIVGIMMERSMEMTVSILGILKAGGTYMPIDPEEPQKRIDYILGDSNTKILVTTQSLAEKSKMVKRREVEAIIFENFFETSNRSRLPPSFSSPGPGGSSLAYIIYTSGTTGSPKGVLVKHSALVNYVLWRIHTYGIKPGDGALQLLSYTFDGFCSNFYSPLLSGSTLIMIPDCKKMDYDYIIQVLRQERVTHMSLVPTMYDVVLHQAGVEDLGRLRFVVLGGEKAPASLIEMSQNKNPGIQHIIEYGPSEATVGAAANVGISPGETAVIGKPIANTCIYILNQYHQPQPVGLTGELFIAGRGLARGYLNNPGLTVEKFVNSHTLIFQTTNDRLYRTGDLGRWLPGGNIEFLGRKDQQVKIRGFRIELGEIENRLLQYPGIDKAVVLARDDEEANLVLCAYIAPDKESIVTGLREYLASELPAHMIPSYFIPIKELPLTPTGKVDKKNLPVLPASIPGTNYVAPRTQMEKKIAAAWKDVLKLEKVGIHDNFFEVGGNSLKIVQVIDQLKGLLERDFRVAEMLNYPTISSFARYIVQEETNEIIPGEEIEESADNMEKALQLFSGVEND